MRTKWHRRSKWSIVPTPWYWHSPPLFRYWNTPWNWWVRTMLPWLWPIEQNEGGSGQPNMINMSSWCCITMRKLRIWLRNPNKTYAMNWEYQLINSRKVLWHSWRGDTFNNSSWSKHHWDRKSSRIYINNL